MVVTEERLTWSEIQEKYPEQWVGLVDVTFELDNSATIESAVVKYTDKTKDELALMQVETRGELIGVYTTPDKALQSGVIQFTLETYEEDGIIHFREPYMVKFSDWVFKHPSCDYIIDKNLSSSEVFYILCYAESKEGNFLLRELLKLKFPNGRLIKGVDYEESLIID